jgi:hypothetical protein
MPYPNPSRQLEVHHSFISDVFDVAHYIQGVLEPVLKAPEAGLYLPGQVDPVLRADREYWYQEPISIQQASRSAPVRTFDAPYNPSPFHTGPVVQLHNQPWQYYRYNYIRVNNLEQVITSPWDVVEMPHGFIPPYFSPNDDMSGTDALPMRVALTSHLAHMCSLTPDVPFAGIKLAKLMLDNEIVATRSFNPSPGKTIEQLITPFISEHYLPPDLSDLDKYEHILEDAWFRRAMNKICESMATVLAPLRNGLYGDSYQMFTAQYQDGFTIRIDQLGDYRIHEWERIVNDPEYQRWLRAKADGSWYRVPVADAYDSKLHL